MVRLIHVGRHAAFVDQWLAGAATDLSPEQLLRLFEVALVALWKCTETTLGEVTVTAVAQRVFLATAEQFPLFAGISFLGRGTLDWSELRKRLSAGPGPELQPAVRFVLAEFLAVLGTLTAEILTPELKMELSRVRLPKPVQQPASTPGEVPKP